MDEFEDKENKSNLQKSHWTELRKDVCKSIKLKQTDKLLEISDECVNSYLDRRSLESALSQNVFLSLFLILLTRSESSCIEIVELFDRVLKESFKALENEVDKLDKIFIGEILVCLNKALEKQHTMNLNRDAIVDFLIQCMKKKCKIEVSSKLLAFSIMKKMLEVENDRDKIVEHILCSLPALSGGKSNLRSKFILTCYENRWFSLTMEEVFTILINQTDDQYQCTEDTMCDISSKMRENRSALLFVFSFIKFFIETENEKGFNIFLRLYKEVVDFYPSRPVEDERYSQLCKELFDLNSINDVYKYYTRKSLLCCLDIMSKKAHPKRTQVARSLLKMNLKNVMSFQRKKLIKTARALTKIDNESIFEVGIMILSILKESLILEVLDSLTDIKKKKVLFSYMKLSKPEIIYYLYLELLLSESTRDIEFVVKDSQALSKVFYRFQVKEICRFLKLDHLRVVDIYSAELALWYSKYYPDRIDTVQLVSFFFESSEDFLVSKNINFYVKLIAILNNIHFLLSFGLKRKLICIFKDLLFYAPYTKEIGGFLSKVGCNKFTISSKTDYLLVVLAACDHPNFQNAFLDCQWTPLKERALVYILSHQPDYGLNYKYKLIEILKDNDILTRLDLLRFLQESFLPTFSEKFNDVVANFYFSFVDEIQEILFDLVRSQEKSISLQTSHLLYTALRNKCLLPEKTIPVFLSHAQSIPDDILQYENVILKNINLIIQLRNWDENDNLLFNLFKKVKDKTTFISNLVLEKAVLHLLTQILKFNRKKYEKIIFEKIREFQMTVEDDSSHKEMNLLSLFQNVN